MKQILCSMLLLCCCVLLFKISSGQQPVLQWAGSISGPGYDEAYAITTDAAGNIYVTGRFVGSTCDFDLGSNSYILNNIGLGDAFVCKYSHDGNVLWARNFGMAGDYTRAEAIAVDDLGNVLTTGTFQHEVDLDPGPGTYVVNGFGYDNDIWISKLDSNGNFIWGRSYIGNVDDDHVYSVAVDHS